MDPSHGANKDLGLGTKHNLTQVTQYKGDLLSQRDKQTASELGRDSSCWCGCDHV